MTPKKKGGVVRTFKKESEVEQRFHYFFFNAFVGLEILCDKAHNDNNKWESVKGTI